MQDLQFAVNEHLAVANTETAAVHSVFADDVAPSALAVLTRDDLNALIETGRELAEEMALDRLLQTILQAASRLTASPDSSVILKSETQPTLYIASATGEQADWILATYGRHSEKQIPIQGSKAGEVFTSGRSLIANVVKGHFTGVDLIAQQTTRSMVCVPLTVGSQRIGVMQVLNRSTGKYTERDRILLEHFATQAAVAIRNAQLVASLLMHSGMYASYRDTEGLVARMDELQQAARIEQLTVLVADMRGFTQLCQTLASPALVQERLSAFLSMLSDAVLEHDGLVNKFLGDGVLALFRGGDYSERAVRCAFAMVEKFEGMKDDWNDEANEQLDFLDIGVGITTDEVIVGGIGTGAVRDFTAIGNAVNLATAFEREARDGRHIICDRATYRRAKKELAEVVDLDDFVLQKPGQSFGVKYKRYQLVAPQSPPRVFISHSHADDAYVLNELVPRLTELGIHTWHSGHDIRNGSLWTAEIRKGIADCNWMLVVVSKHAASSKWVRREVDLALAIGHLDERVVSLIMDDTPLKDVNEYLAALQGIDARQHKDIAEILARAFVNAN